MVIQQIGYSKLLTSKLSLEDKRSADLGLELLSKAESY